MVIETIVTDMIYNNFKISLGQQEGLQGSLFIIVISVSFFFKRVLLISEYATFSE